MDGAGLPKISVVIPTRGRPLLVSRAVASAFRQTLPPAEVVVVVDGEDPDTVHALDELEEPRLHVVLLDVSVGAAGARNVGMRHATGDWIALLDDDDEWLPTKLAAQWDVLAARRNRSRVVVATAAFWRTEVAVMVWPRRAIRDDERLAEYLFVRNMPGEGALFTPTLLMSRELALSHSMPEHLSVHEDHDWLLSLEADGAEFVVLTEPLVNVQGGSVRQSASRAASWSASLSWALSREQQLGPRAFSGFLLTEVGRTVAREPRLRRSMGVLLLALTGRARARDVARFAGFHLLSEPTRWRLGAMLRRPALPAPGLRDRAHARFRS